MNLRYYFINVGVKQPDFIALIRSEAEKRIKERRAGAAGALCILESRRTPEGTQELFQQQMF